MGANDGRRSRHICSSPSASPSRESDCVAERPRHRAAEEGDELASFQLVELHPIPHEPGAPRAREILASVALHAPSV
jgi:hypothetical protein